MATHPSILALESHGQRSLASYSPQGHKELNMTEAAQHALRSSHSKCLQEVQRRYSSALGSQQ